MPTGERTLEIMAQLQESLQEHQADFDEVQRNAAEVLANALRNVLAGEPVRLNSLIYHGVPRSTVEGDQELGVNEARTLEILAQCRVDGKLVSDAIASAIDAMPTPKTKSIVQRLDLVRRAIEADGDSIWQLPARATLVRALSKRGIKTTAQLTNFLREGSDLASFPGVGEVKAAQIIQAHATYLSMTGLTASTASLHSD